MSLKLVVPKGRMNAKIVDLLNDIGIYLAGQERSYRPRCNDSRFEVKLLKSQNIPQLVAMGQHDCGFAGADWVAEQNAEVEMVLDLGFDPVRIVAAVPEDWKWEQMKQRPLIAVSEYRNLTERFLRQAGVEFTFLRSYGATEVFPPEDADLIVDNTATGSTLVANRLKIVEVLMTSSTHFIANRKALEDPERRSIIEDLKLLMEGTLAGRSRVLLEMNCPADKMEAIVAMLPAMKAPTVSQLYQRQDFSIKAAIPKDSVRSLVPQLRQAGASDILELAIEKVLP